MATTWPDGTTVGRSVRTFQDLLYSSALNLREFADNDTLTTDASDAFDAAITACSALGTGGSTLGRALLVPQGNWMITRPINVMDVPLIGEMRSAQITASPSFSGGSHMLRNWATSDYTAGETDTTLPPANCATPHYYAVIDGIYLRLNAVTGLRGLGLVHLHETSYLEHLTFSAPGAGSIAIHLPNNSDTQGSLNGNVTIENITVYPNGGNSPPWAQELLTGNGSISLKIDNWTTCPSVHSTTVFDLNMIDVEISRLHCEAYVDTTLVDADAATIRLRDCGGAVIHNSIWTNAGSNTYMHPFIFASNTHGSGFNVDMSARDLIVNLTGTYDPAVPMIKDETQTGGQYVFFDSQAWVDYTPTHYEWFRGSTGTGGSRLLRQGTARVSAIRNANQTIPDSTATAITFEAAQWDRELLTPAWDALNPTRLSMHLAGHYTVGCTFEFAANATGYREISIRRSGNATQVMEIDRRSAVSGADTTICHFQFDYQFAALEYVEFIAYQTSGGNLDVQGQAVGPTRFKCRAWVNWLGPLA